jgi:hypothetical protein
MRFDCATLFWVKEECFYNFYDLILENNICRKLGTAP